MSIGASQKADSTNSPIHHINSTKKAVNRGYVKYYPIDDILLVAVDVCPIIANTT